MVRSAREGASRWSLHARFDRSHGHVTVSGTVVGPDGGAVARRDLATDRAECAAAATGLGVWASLVFDATESREFDRAAALALPPPPPAPAEPPPSHGPTPNTPDTLGDARPPDADLFLRHRAGERTVEIGLDGFVMAGTGGGAVVGPSIYGIFESGRGLFLRPALLGGHSIGGLSRLDAPGTFFGSRLDACGRVPGMYREHIGLQLDLCLGADVGFSRLDAGVAQSSTVPFVAIGPSLGFRGELGSRLSAVIRGVADVSLVSDRVMLASGAPMSTSTLVVRGEAGLSWSLR